MIRTLFLVKIEPELLCRPSIEHLKSPGPYDVYYRMGYAVLWSLWESMQQDLSCCSSPASCYQEAGLFLTDSHVCLSRCGYQLHRDLALPHEHVQILTETAAARSCIDLSLQPKFLSVCEMDRDREKLIEEDVSIENKRLREEDTNEMLRRDGRFMLWTLPSSKSAAIRYK